MQILNPEGIYNFPGFASGVKVGNTIYSAGRVPINLEGNVIAPNDARTQTEHVMEDLKAILSEGGATLQDVVYMHTYTLHSDDKPIIHKTRQRYLGDHFPPHTGSMTSDPSWVERGIRVEIEVIAVLED